MNKTAQIEGDYRYTLGRYWGDGRRVLFIGVNPSTADAHENDATLRRLISFAKDWGFGGLKVVNLFALISTDPKALKTHPNPVGPDNDLHLITAVQQHGVIIPMWGNNGGFKSRDKEVTKLLKDHVSAHHRLAAFGYTKLGCPKHPLYLPTHTELVTFPEIIK